jgi:hypothetical protein
MQFRNKAKEQPPDEITRLRALAAKIDQHRGELDEFLDEYARLLTTPGVPTVNLRQMIDGRGRCLCHSTALAVSDRLAALELEEKQRSALSEG